MPTKKKSGGYSLSVRVTEFRIPPVTDGLILGRESPIGYAAISKALNLLTANNFEAIELDHDEVVSHIILRRDLLRRIPRDRLIAFALERLKPLMGPHEILHLDMTAEVTVEGDNI